MTPSLLGCGLNFTGLLVEIFVVELLNAFRIAANAGLIQWQALPRSRMQALSSVHPQYIQASRMALFLFALVDLKIRCANDGRNSDLRQFDCVSLGHFFIGGKQRDRAPGHDAAAEIGNGDFVLGHDPDFKII
jgi:hypothetical protein